MTDIQICHTVPSINQETGGAAYCVTQLASSLAQQENISSYLFTLDYPNRGKQVKSPNVILHSQKANILARKIRGFQPSFAQELDQLAQEKLDLIHSHGLWMFPHIYARQAAVKNNIPLVISPHGTLEPWSLKRSRLIKSLAWFLYEHKNLQSATLFHATSVQELKSIRQLGFSQPIAVIPIGLDVPDLSSKPDKTLLTNQFPELQDKQWLLFLSRIHPKKGIDNLLYSWKSIANQFPHWHLVIAGPDLTGYQLEIDKLTSELNLTSRVTFTGMLTGEIKASALANADLFVLPTHSENFGIVIAESLAYGVPVITTKETPWQDLETYNCGWWIDDQPQILTHALTQALNLSSQELEKMGKKGRDLILEKYSWDIVAKNMKNVYNWILTGGTLPSCIDLTSSEGNYL